MFTTASSSDARKPRAQVSLHVITMAFVVVLCTCGLLIPIMLYVFQVSSAYFIRGGRSRHHLP